ncbi:MAG: oleandomycin transport system permease protein [Micromonosporaceae bacterium]|jgi:oleandomycin transport system permease protein|nr:oleandomycin transport system permease protein [Micromonosporaceae bacterium]
MATITHPAPARRVGPVRAAQHSLTLAWRAVVKIRHNPEQLLDVTLQPIVFVTMFVFLFGGAIGNGDRHQYLQFVLPGVMVQTIIFASAGTGTNLNTDITKGIFDRFRSLPIARSAPLTGLILGDIFRYLVTLAVVIGYGMILGFRFHTNPLSVLAGVALVMGFALAMCWIWALAGLLVKTPQSMQGLGFVIGFPLTFGSNVFVQTATMPGWLQAWVKINPVTALTDSARGLMVTGGPVATPVWHTLVWAAAIIAVFAPLAVGRYRHKT